MTWPCHGHVHHGAQLNAPDAHRVAGVPSAVLFRARFAPVNRGPLDGRTRPSSLEGFNMSVRALGILLLKLWGLVTLVSGATAALSLTFEILFPMIRADDALVRYALMNNGRGGTCQQL